MHGDRTQGDDKSIRGGLVWIEGKKLILISHSILTSDSPETTIKQTGLRKITRLLNIAKQLKRPVLLTKSEFQHTHQSKEVLAFDSIDGITQNLKIMSHLPVPIIAILSGTLTIIDTFVLAMADCIIAHHDFEALVQEILVRIKTQSPQISELMDTVLINDAKMIPALRQTLPAKIDELMSIPTDNLISRRIIRVQSLSNLSYAKIQSS